LGYDGAVDYLPWAGALIALLSAATAVVAAVRIKQAADKRLVDRKRIAAVTNVGQGILEDVLKEKREHPDDPNLGHQWSRHDEWLGSVSDVIIDTDETFAPIFHARIVNNELEAAMTERLERLYRILEKM
jgi:hypothetical protein